MLTLQVNAQYLAPGQFFSGMAQQSQQGYSLAFSIGGMMAPASGKSGHLSIQQGLFADAAYIRGLDNKQEEENLRIKLDVFPNPVVNIVHVKLNEHDTHTYQVSVYDSFGRRFQNISTARLSGYNTQVKLNLQPLRTGQYFIRVVDMDTQKTVGTFKIIKQAF